MANRLVIQEPFYSHEEAIATVKIIAKLMEEGFVNGSDPNWWLEEVKRDHVTDLPNSSAYTDESLMPLGKHKGEKLINVPASYLLWYYEQNEGKSIKIGSDAEKLFLYCRENLSVLKHQTKK